MKKKLVWHKVAALEDLLDGRVTSVFGMAGHSNFDLADAVRRQTIKGDMSDQDDDFYVGYGALPKKDRRFLLAAVPAGLLGLAGAGAFVGTQAGSQGGGQPVFFSMGIGGGKDNSGPQTCGGNGYFLANAGGKKINDEILEQVAVPVTIEAGLEKIRNLYCLLYKEGSLRRIS